MRINEIVFSGGFHYSDEISIYNRPLADAIREQGNQISIYEYLSENQIKKLDNHFCGIDSCTCGGVSQASYEVLE